jgi:hypothetical protein
LLKVFVGARSLRRRCRGEVLPRDPSLRKSSELTSPAPDASTAGALTATAYPETDVRVSSSLGNANFTTDGVDIAIRNLPSDDRGDLSLTIEKLTDISFVPVCSPKLIKLHGRSTRPQTLACMPLIHDDMLADRPHVPTWTDWFKAAGRKASGVRIGFGAMRIRRP